MITLLTAGLVFSVTVLTLVSVLTLTGKTLRRELGNQLLTLATTGSPLVIPPSRPPARLLVWAKAS